MGHAQEVRRPGINQTSLQHRGKRKQLDLPAPPVRELALVAAAAVAAAGGPEIVETALGWASQVAECLSECFLCLLDFLGSVAPEISSNCAGRAWHGTPST